MFIRSFVHRRWKEIRTIPSLCIIVLDSYTWSKSSLSESLIHII
uniref:Uncharacterized protein n=1 Tax=Nelumbo nucifera TaxID=4432 RepID=A0A822ZQ02_NELNU|nr:TPA_asm: hypothetical protein HUJ06_016915 [Nelumbo nucifera]